MKVKPKSQKFEYPFPRPSVTVDNVVFNWFDEEIYVLLIKRAKDPYKDKWAFPGGFVDEDEPLDVAAARELHEETGLDLNNLIMFGAFGDPGRDPRGHTVTIAYYSILLDFDESLKAASDASDLSWEKLSDVKTMAFDHIEILQRALLRIKDDVKLSLLDNRSYFDLTKNQKLTLFELIRP